MLGESVREHSLISHRRVREHERDIREARRQIGQRIHPRHSASRVDEDRDARLIGHRENRFDGRATERERLCAGVELDAASSTCETATGFGHRIIGRVEPAIGHDPSLAAGGPREHLVIRPPVGRAAIRVVKRERARARLGADLVQESDQRRRQQPLPVLVGAEVGVRIDHAPVTGP